MDEGILCSNGSVMVVRTDQWLSYRHSIQSSRLSSDQIFDFLKRVAATIFVDGSGVSTVFLEFDHGFGQEPLWFETMIIGADSQFDFQERFQSIFEALEFHDHLVGKILEERFDGRRHAVVSEQIRVIASRLPKEANESPLVTLEAYLSAPQSLPFLESQVS